MESTDRTQQLIDFIWSEVLYIRDNIATKADWPHE